MKIAVISDTHLGFGSGTKREKDAFIQAKQALEIAVKEKVDAVLLPGDLFDESIPKQETLHEAFQLFSLAFNAEKSEAKIFKDSKELKFSGIPLIAIAGTHEFRSKDYKNALQVIESAGFLFYLHASHIVLEKGKEKVAVFGLSGVPEKKALDVLKAWNPKPLNECKNILLLHQSIKEFLATDDEMSVTISLSDLPKGFDYTINGHLHWSQEKSLASGKFILAGSTICTQMKSLEAGKPKGFYILDTVSSSISFNEIPVQRKIFYHREKFEDSKPSEVLQKVSSLIKKDLELNGNSLEPLIRVKCIGGISKGYSSSDVSFSEIEKTFNEKAILSLDKDFASASFRKGIEELRELQKQKKGIAELGFDLLEKNLKETDFSNAFDVREIFDLLAEGKTEEVIELLSKKRPTN